MMNSSKRGMLIASAAALLGVSALLQNQLDRPDMRRQKAIEPTNPKVFSPIGRSGAALPFEYSLGAISGFRQVVAGLLWVRADSFFHQGNYDAILPLIRIITWMDPNFLDVYATGAWHLTYNFTDEEQRSDRRYLPAGRALLNEMIQNNPDLWDGYKEAGWLNFDKIKDFDEAVRYYQEAMHKKDVDLTQVGHLLAHSLEKSGRVDDATRMWAQVIKDHEAALADPKTLEENKGRVQMGLWSAQKNLAMIKVRQAARLGDTKVPVDAQFQVTVTRIRPKVIEVTGRMNLLGAKNFDERIWGPVDGARVDIRLEDQGYKMPDAREFTFEVDPDLTIMQDSVSVRGGTDIRRGAVFIVGGSLSPQANLRGVYAVETRDLPKGLGVPLSQALAGAAPLSADAKSDLAYIALPREARAAKGNAQTINALFERLRRDQAMISDLDKQGVHVALKDYDSLGKFKKTIDMSRDPRMYSFAKDKYDLVVSFNPRIAPEMVQDRFGWSGEGMTDKRFLDTKTKPGLRMLRLPITLSREDLTGQGQAVLYPRQVAQKN